MFSGRGKKSIREFYFARRKSDLDLFWLSKKLPTVSNTATDRPNVALEALREYMQKHRQWNGWTLALRENLPRRASHATLPWHEPY
jgi:hypothetical protein